MSADPLISSLEAVARQLRARQRRLDQLHERLTLQEQSGPIAALRLHHTARNERARTRRRSVLGLVMMMQVLTVAVLLVFTTRPPEAAEATVVQVVPEPVTVAQVVPEPVAPPPEVIPEPVAEPAPPPCAAGRACSPIAIDTLPFRATGDTRLAEDAVMHSYSCMPTLGEAGPEVWYAITITEPGQLIARINETRGDAIDVDVHLLSAPSSDACVTRGDAALGANVQPGEYFVVVDTCSSWNGIPLPGPYQLDVQFKPR